MSYCMKFFMQYDNNFLFLCLIAWNFSIHKTVKFIFVSYCLKFFMQYDSKIFFMSFFMKFFMLYDSNFYFCVLLHEIFHAIWQKNLILCLIAWNFSIHKTVKFIFVSYCLKFFMQYDSNFYFLCLIAWNFSCNMTQNYFWLHFYIQSF